MIDSEGVSICLKHGRMFTGIEVEEVYVRIARQRIVDALIGGDGRLRKYHLFSGPFDPEH